MDEYIKKADVEQLSTADVVEVVRCHECKHYKIQEKSKHWQNKKRYCCRSAIVKVSDFDFCSYGERKDVSKMEITTEGDTSDA